jgi:SAM-dependent methyltransferase
MGRCSNGSLYDSNDYYAADGEGSRLSPLLEPVVGCIDRLRAKKLLAILDIPLGTIPCVLDIGAGTGGFLAALQRMGAEVHGTTASLTAQAAAARRYGLALRCATDIPTDVGRESFNAITYWHVFEHLEDPESHVSAWPRLLGERGIVLVEVPNVDSMGARLCSRAWLGSDPVHHINMMSLQEIKLLLARHGMTIRRAEGLSLKFTYVYLWSALLGLMFGRAYDFDNVFDVLKRPKYAFTRRPVRTLNAMAAIIYLFPVIVLCTICGWITDHGEVLRLVIERSRSGKPRSGSLSVKD